VIFIESPQAALNKTEHLQTINKRRHPLLTASWMHSIISQPGRDAGIFDATAQV
jgi:hypothetical protein